MVTNDGAPRGEKTFLLWNPTLKPGQTSQTNTERKFRRQLPIERGKAALAKKLRNGETTTAEPSGEVEVGVACSGTGAGLGAPRRDGTSAVTRCAGTVGDEGAEVVRVVRAGIAVNHVFKLPVVSSVLADGPRARRWKRQRQIVRRYGVNRRSVARRRVARVEFWSARVREVG